MGCFFSNLTFLLSSVSPSSETKTILVQNYILQDKIMSCSMPFSWRIRNHLEELWVHALQKEGNGLSPGILHN